MMLTTLATTMAITAGQRIAIGVGTKFACTAGRMIATGMVSKKVSEKEMGKAVRRAREIKDENERAKYLDKASKKAIVKSALISAPVAASFGLANIGIDYAVDCKTGYQYNGSSLHKWADATKMEASDIY